MMMTFDCVQMKNDIQEKIWKEAGETFEGLIELLNIRSKDNELLKKLLERKEKTEILKAV
jgi:hypothetical protein